MRTTHRFSGLVRAIAVALAGCTLVGLSAGCRKGEPEPTVPGYYTGPIKPKGEVAPGPTTGGEKVDDKAGSKSKAAGDTK